MKILITGAAGFIGSHLAEYFLKQGNIVTGIDNLSGAYPSRTYQHTLSVLAHYSAFSFEDIDIRSRTRLSQCINETKPAMIVHAAALTGIRDGATHPYQYVENNVLGTQNLLEACKERPERTVVLLSSSSVYGSQKKVPFREDAHLNPTSIYAISKQSVEAIAEYYSRQYGLDVLVIRPFSIYGPRGRMNMLPFLLLRSAITGQPFYQYGTDENNKRDWTYIDDFVKAVSGLIQSKKHRFEIVNIGSGNPVGIDDFIDEFRKQAKSILGKTIIIKKKSKPDYEMDITYADTKKLRGKIGRISFTPVRQGIRRFLQFYQKHQSVYF